MKPFHRLGRFFRRPPSPRRISTSSNFPVLDPATKIEEERMPAYERGLFYPVKYGDVFESKYQVLSKLGFGANSTVWLCRDLHDHRYIALKVYIRGPEANQEVRILKHLAGMKTNHPGRGLVRSMIEEFQVAGPEGSHQCIVYEPLLTSLLHFQATLNPKSLSEDLLKGALQQLLLGLDYLHSEAGVIHTDIQAKNIIIGSMDDGIFRQWDEDEQREPSPRKVDGGYIVYQSRLFRREKGWNGGFGMPVLCDFGEARMGDEHDGLIQPDIYRAPEVVLGMRWTEKVDIWNVGALIWDLFEDHHLFDGRGPDGVHSNAHLLAEMVAVLGPPPVGFLRKSSRSELYWDSLGQWKHTVEIPDNSLEDSEEYLEGENKEMFMRFVRKMLRWDPEERQSARELLTDPWLTGP
ncbi:kinase-like protein [Aspergillus sclerotioniger CBS 115572]|uniref:non-specific serine/threonine protein kinase n=1 Tax=Aspergillus sclerotioniger CBS 115572 TaxID=1450535 RepID=A0A317XAH7_9EURO|nr:kinase-like protein [Aspergillus sclerotioniger CBS 115572]PWY95405.1 kinase-like protein [Aspergillus sclerotioniger CBS 115572]